jgi:hypothetical protein
MLINELKKLNEDAQKLKLELNQFNDDQLIRKNN